MWKYFLALALLILLALTGWHCFNNPTDHSIKSIVCDDITKGCGTKALKIRFNQMPQVMRPFNVVMEAPSANAVHASFAMQGMEMGLNRYRLIQQADKTWRSEVTLPVCVQGRSDWVMMTELETSAGLERYQLKFQATR